MNTKTSSYALAIGGSGSRCVEALIYLCAAGLGPPGKLTLVFVDPDRNNYSLTRALRLAELYTTLQAFRRGDQCPYFGTQIVCTTPKYWTPFNDAQSAPNLGGFFQYDVMRRQKMSDAALFDVVYTPEQQKADLTVGFRGRPSIGAAVFGAKVGLEAEEPWRALVSQIASESANTVKIFSFGSLFGGTGAAGLPTIPRLLCMKRNPDTGEELGRSANTYTGAALLLPYFNFPPPTRDTKGEVFAQSEFFILNAKEALRYYAECNPDFNRVFVLGAEAVTEQKEFEIGGAKQANLPSYVELLAALGARDFYREEDSRGAKVAIIGRTEPNSIGWQDLPDGGTVQARLGQFTRAAFAYCKYFHPRLEELSSIQHSWYWTLSRRRAWYQDLFERRRVSLNDTAVASGIKYMREFSALYLNWLGDLHAGNRSDGGFRVALADASAFPNPDNPETFAEDKFGRLVGEGGRKAISLDDVLRHMANRGVNGMPNAAGFGSFQRALYDACAAA